MMAIQWTFFVAAGQVPELKTEPVRIAFHLAAEAATACLLIVGGIALLRRVPWGPKLALVANGILLYTVIVTPGYFAQSGRLPPVGMFGVVLVLTLLSIRSLLRKAAQ
jgi:hypothetical protein